ncbi:hypothetical protein [Polaribacter gangjinensis]|uniref:hypothetical protein n=1 Tax=Polaribacter gangjinensis TaxID=574710 RepID=UPI001B80CD7E|nr:hypothetical protein [Polaribacter gangjinensis]
MKVFKEEQRFTQLWLIILIIFSSLVPIGVVISEYQKDENAFSVEMLLVIILLILVPLAIIFLFKLSTRIDEQGIHYQFFPFHFSDRKISWNEISKAYVRTYDPIGEFGGWGLKGGNIFNKSKGKAINVSGDIGIQLELKNGKKLLIGTQKEAEAKSVLQTYQNNNS